MQNISKIIVQADNTANFVSSLLIIIICNLNKLHGICIINNNIDNISKLSG